MANGPEAVLLLLGLLLAAARVGGEFARRLGQPAVVGEILVGIILGPSLLGFVGPFGDAEDAGMRAVEVVAQLGVLVLLFEVGLESSLVELRKVGASAVFVGLAAVILSVGTGFGLSWFLAGRVEWLQTDLAAAHPGLLHVFVGIVFAATSVGINARTLRDMGKIRTTEARIILGAAMVGDALALVALAVIGGISSAPSQGGIGSVGWTLAVMLLFFLVVILGAWLAPRIDHWLHKAARGDFVHLTFGFTVLLLMSYVATRAGLAPIVGAFAAGLMLSASDHRHQLFESLRPVGGLLTGLFFLVLGARVDLQVDTPATPRLVLGIVILLSVAGILAKLVAGLGVVHRRVDRYVVAVGMVPRGGIGLIFVLFGLENGLLANWQYMALVLFVLTTTFVTQPWLQRIRGRFGKATAGKPPESARVAELGTA